MRRLSLLLVLAVCAIADGPLQFVDRYQSTLASGCTLPCTSLSVSSASGLPALSGTQFFMLIVKADGGNTEEVFKVTAISGTTLTVTGAQAGTTASNHGAGATVIASIMTAGAYSQFQTDILAQVASGPSITQGTYASLPGSCTTNDVYFMTDSVYQARCSATNTWSYFYQGAGSVTLPPTGSWSWDNQGSSTVSSTYGYLYLTFLRSSAVSIRAYYRSAPATPYSLTVLLSNDISGLPGGSAVDSAYLVGFRDGAGKFVLMRLGYTNANGYSIFTDKWTNSTTFSANYLTYFGGASSDIVTRNPTWLRVTDCGSSSAGVCSGNSGNLVFWYSLDGQTWTQVDARARTDFMASGPNAVFVGAYVNGCQVLTSILSLTLQ